jgi:hypothetical protein
MSRVDAGAEAPEFVTEDELAEAALAADPEAVVPDDAMSLWDLSSAGEEPLLPQWYMPAPMTGSSGARRWWRWVAILLIVAFLAIEAYGLCSTYGEVVLG